VPVVGFFGELYVGYELELERDIRVERNVGIQRDFGVERDSGHWRSHHRRRQWRCVGRRLRGRRLGIG